jgi:Predicted hydrolases or acyltransferases (alpha/beta hydrolase superfamily)
MVSRTRLAASGLLVALLGASVTLSARLTKQEADQFSAKLTKIVQHGNVKPLKPGPAQTTQISDNELNAYFKYHAQSQIPVGIVDPTINALGDGRVGGRAVVDLDAVRKRLSNIRNGKLVTIDDAGHMLHHDQPAAVAAAIEPFLDA